LTTSLGQRPQPQPRGMLILRPGGECPRDRYSLGSANPPTARTVNPGMDIEPGSSSICDDSSAVGDGMSVPSGDGARASHAGTAGALVSVAVRGARVTLPRRPEGLIDLPLPPGFGMCLLCMWVDANGDREAVAQHRRETAHPTIYRPSTNAQATDGGR
jgi:hypothetical protein